ncbi:hypothetical protein KUTeg_019631 [Tegillarca granosa]|uniref:Uncharacterized protein n=1 Tax=Tegillarca granosa TaxID=220873 RepID=A0ABQ9EI99_TEGGR|nr:hypothetical protein KUTeg_019631 [Tegillarca granosa]
MATQWSGEQVVAEYGDLQEKGIDVCGFIQSYREEIQRSHLHHLPQLIWDTTNVRQSKVTLNPGSPVWRARYTSSGQGLVTTVVPQLRRGDNSLYLWNISNNSQPVHQFVGHHDVILEFQWRKQPEGSRDIQLVTWSKDHSLRIWKIDPQLQRNGQDRVYTEQQLLTSTSPDVIPGKQPCSLQQEFDLVNINIPNITVEEMDVMRRTCTVTAQNFKFKICLSMYFPTNYPNNASPTFDFTNSTISIKVQHRLNKVEDRRTPDSEPYGLNQTGNKSIISPFSTFGGALQDINIPFPRTSGAKFCCAGYLVVFGRSKEAKKGPTGSELTPKALSDLTNFAANKRIRTAHNAGMFPPYAYSRSPPASSSDFVSISNYYYREKPPSRQYAIQQILQKSQVRTKDSSKSKYRDVEKGGTKKPSIGSVWSMDSYRDIFDVQTLAMLCCVFWKREDMQKKTESIPQALSTNSIDYIPPNLKYPSKIIKVKEQIVSQFLGVAQIVAGICYDGNMTMRFIRRQCGHCPITFVWNILKDVLLLKNP